MEYIMQNNSSIGILFDTICYCINQFDLDSHDNIIHADEIFSEAKPVPKILMPFFYQHDSLPAPILTYCKEKMFMSGSIPELSEALREDNELDTLKKNVLDVLFYPDNSTSYVSHSDCSMKTAQRLDGTSLSSEMKYQALLCLTYFRHSCSELCRTLSELEDDIHRLHQKYEGETDAVFSAIRSGKYDQLYKCTADLDPGSFNEITVSFSILRPELLMSVTDQKRLILLAGKDHVDSLVRAFDEESIDISAFFDDIGNELRRMILDALAEKSELTASDISRCTGIPVTTALRHMEALCDNYLIKVSRRKGTQIFYTLNREYLEKARIKTDKYLR